MDVGKLRIAFEALALDIDQTGEEPPWGWDHQRQVALERFAEHGMEAFSSTEPDDDKGGLITMDMFQAAMEDGNRKARDPETIEWSEAVVASLNRQCRELRRAAGEGA